MGGMMRGGMSCEVLEEFVKEKKEKKEFNGVEVFVLHVEMGSMVR